MQLKSQLFFMTRSHITLQSTPTTTVWVYNLPVKKTLSIFFADVNRLLYNVIKTPQLELVQLSLLINTCINNLNHDHLTHTLDTSSPRT